MTDRELLELAARAIRMELRVDLRGYHVCERWEPTPVNTWNPLTDDGDALRLANDTGTCIEFGYCPDDAPIVRCGPIHERESWPQVGNFPDPGKATRRAIVEAVAAEQQAYEAATSGVRVVDLRQQFEAWTKRQPGDEMALDGSQWGVSFLYSDPLTQAAWIGYQGAARTLGVGVDAKPIDTRQLKQTLEAATRCLQRNDWGTAFDRVQDALALLPDGVTVPPHQTFCKDTPP